jgi:hypothetical protein
MDTFRRKREVPATPAPLASDRYQWVSRRRAAHELGIDQRSLPKAADAAGVRTKTIPGVPGRKYFLPDVLEVARQSVRGADPKRTARAE